MTSSSDRSPYEYVGFVRSVTVEIQYWEAAVVGALVPWLQALASFRVRAGKEPSANDAFAQAWPNRASGKDRPEAALVGQLDAHALDAIQSSTRRSSTGSGCEPSLTMRSSNAFTSNFEPSAVSALWRSSMILSMPIL